MYHVLILLGELKLLLVTVFGSKYVVNKYYFVCFSVTQGTQPMCCITLCTSEIP